MKVLMLGESGKSEIVKKFQNARNEVITVDINPERKPTIVHNLNRFPYPFKTNEFDLVLAPHILEHLNNLVKAMEEIHRITKPHGKVIIRVPHFSSVGAWLVPTYHRGFSIDSFDLFCLGLKEEFGKGKFKVERKELRYVRQDVKHNLLVRLVASFLNFLAKRNFHFCERVWCYWVGGFSEVYVELKVIK